MRSTREIAQIEHFDPKNLVPQPIPDPDNGTVDIQYNLVSKANDQIEFSAGWGQTGVIGKLRLKFTNFSMKNLLNPSTYKGIIPQGEGQTLTLSGQTNGRYYQAYSISFMESRHSPTGSPAACASPPFTEHKDSPQGAASVDPDTGEIRPSAALPSTEAGEEE